MTAVSTPAPGRTQADRPGRTTGTGSLSGRGGGGARRPPGRGPAARARRPIFAVGRGAPRAPFVLLVLLVAGGGLVALLVLNTAIASASFQVQSLRAELDELTVKEQSLQQDVSAAEAPGALAEAAQKLGMMPSEHPGYLLLKPDGSYEFVGEPAPAGAPAPDPDESAQDDE